MNITARIALAAGGAAASYVATDALTNFAERRTQRQHDEVAERTDAAQQEWTGWKQALEAAVPSLDLQTPQDHARLDRFLAEHPAPDWITVEHAPYTRARIDAHTPLDRDLTRDRSEGDFMTAALGVLFTAGGLAGGVAGALGIGAHGWRAGGIAAGGGALAAFGLVMARDGIGALRRGEQHLEPMRALVREVNAYDDLPGIDDASAAAS